MNPLILQLKKLIPLYLTVFTLGCLVLSPKAQAVSPPPDGGYSGGNTAEGDNALLTLTSGKYNSAFGFSSLLKNAEGNFNTAIGAGALLLNTASENTAIGAGALFKNAPPFTTGDNGNTAAGAFALFNSTGGSSNTAIGDRALFNVTSGSNNIALGVSAGSGVTTATSNVICIGSAGANVSNACFIGNIFGANPTGSSQVVINNAGRLGTIASSRRFKDDIKPMDDASKALYLLKPVCFRYKKEIDPVGTSQFGLVAEDVEKVSRDLIVRDKEGKPYSVRYDQVNAMLLNEFLKEHRTVQGQQKEIDALKAELKEQKAFIQKVSDQIEVTKTGPQVVNNP